MKKGDKRQEHTENQWLATMCQLLKGGAIAAVISVVALLLGAFLVSAGVLRESMMNGTVLATCVLGAFIGGLLIVRRTAGPTLLLGLGVAAIQFLLLLTVGYLMYENASIEHGGMANLCACCCGGAMAGILGRRRTKKKRRR